MRALLNDLLELAQGIAEIIRFVSSVIFYPALFVSLASGAAALVVGFWDGLVWLFKADWRTTVFQFPLYAGLACGVAFVVFFVFAAIAGIAEAFEKWCDRHKISK
jgi:hypothetical protein